MAGIQELGACGFAFADVRMVCHHGSGTVSNSAGCMKFASIPGGSCTAMTDTGGNNSFCDAVCTSTSHAQDTCTWSDFQ